MYTPASEIKTRTLLSAMGEMGYHAVNVGERELMAGYENFFAMKSGAKVPLISANMVFQSTGKSIVDPYTILTFEPKKYPSLEKPLRIAVAGVTRFNPTFLKSAPPKDNVIIANPQDALKAILPEMRKKADQVIVLAAMSKDDAHILARELPGIDLILGSFGGWITAVEEKEGKTSILYCGTQGKWLAELRTYNAEGVTQVKSQLHYLNAQYPEDATMKAKVDAALVEINSAGKAGAGRASLPPTGSAAAAAAAGPAPKTFLTAEACKTCHPAEHAAWVGSAHAHAMQTLVDSQADFNTECVGCHVVAYKKPGGFVDSKSTGELANVQCEACHGPGAKHVNNPSVPYFRSGKPSCLGCHNKEHSPSFDYETYWPKIKHGA